MCANHYFSYFCTNNMPKMQKSLTLYELNNLVAEVVRTTMPDEYWVEAEISELREVRGHCYMELVQKDLMGVTPVARASAKCWRTTWLKVRDEFERVTRSTLHRGMKVMLCVYADFHEAYGFSWIVTDINPEYTMGDMARRRQETINRLKAEGVFNLQRELTLPLFAQRLAVVSSEKAAGYGDFCRHLADNSYGFAFDVHLFQAAMQGESVGPAIIAALEHIYCSMDDYDVVVIIRGGGATSDLSGFDSFELAENVANFPLPVVTGVGHDRDETVLDLVSAVSVKTPTAAAAYLIDRLAAVSARIDDAAECVSRCAQRRMEYERMRLGRLADVLPGLFSLTKSRETARLDRLHDTIASASAQRIVSARHSTDTMAERIHTAARSMMAEQNHRVDLLSHRIKAADPYLLLKRGYSITLHNGRAVYDASQLGDGDTLETIVNKGRVKSVVRK